MPPDLVIPPPLEPPVLTVGVVADTHIPDRFDELHPQVLDGLRRMGAQLILHAGDISTPGVLKELETVAPVVAVRGNRDWLFRGVLPYARRLELAGVPVALMHGRGGGKNYLRDKFYYIRDGYDLDRYRPTLEGAVPDARVVVFGHTHAQEALWIDGRLLFNPGSAAMGAKRGLKPGMGVLYFYSGERVGGHHISLNGYELSGRRWISRKLES